jgi:predicted transcriptional regulator of viral defense system
MHKRLGNKVDSIERALVLFRKHGGVMRTSEAMKAGIHPATLYRMRNAKIVIPMTRGLYRVAEMQPLREPDLLAVAKKIPHAVICLVSALAIHELTSEIPHAIDCAILRGSERPRLTYPPIRIHWYQAHSFHAGIETREVDGVKLRVYGPEKTIADCFQRRNRIGFDIALDGLKRYVARRDSNMDLLLRFCRANRVHSIIRPYLEALL